MIADVADHFLQALGRPATYTSPGGSPVSIRVIVQDTDKEIRSGRTTDLIAAQATASVSASISPRRGGLIEVGGTQYEIHGLVTSAAPGLTDLALIRLSGSGVETFDVSEAVLQSMGEPVVIDGVNIVAQVNRSGLLLEEDKYGNAIEVIRNVLGVALADAVAIDEGSIVELDGRDRIVLRVLRDGTGMTRVIC